jgi:hypothetical protein
MVDEVEERSYERYIFLYERLETFGYVHSDKPITKEEWGECSEGGKHYIIAALSARHRRMASAQYTPEAAASQEWGTW